MPPTLEQLAGLIGRRTRYRGRELLVVDVLGDSAPELVLQEAPGPGVIQSNQFGEANRRVPETWTIPVLAPNGRDLHRLFVELDLL